MATVKEQKIRDAISAVENGQQQKEAAELHGVYPLTLPRRLRGVTNYKVSKTEA